MRGVEESGLKISVSSKLDFRKSNLRGKPLRTHKQARGRGKKRGEGRRGWNEKQSWQSSFWWWRNSGPVIRLQGACAPSTLFPEKRPAMNITLVFFLHPILILPGELSKQFYPCENSPSPSPLRRTKLIIMLAGERGTPVENLNEPNLKDYYAEFAVDEELKWLIVDFALSFFF